MTDFMEILLVSLYFLLSSFLSIHGFNAMINCYRFQRKAARRHCKALVPTSYSPLLVQLPIYNEANCVQELIDCLVSQNYPKNSFIIQILDDSNDETSTIIQSSIAKHSDHKIEHIQRHTRSEFKAGALAYGMSLHPEIELIAIFDADFRPSVDFLSRAIVQFEANPNLGLIQGRWEHSNRNFNFFTRFQALGMDGHFAIEQPARAWNKHLMNFNGTAGVWRKDAILAAGGWSGDTLTEDLDLSYRAQLRSNYQLDYDYSLSCPAEIPVSIQAFKTQQARWAKGSVQTLKKLAFEVMLSKYSIPTKLEALLHLSHYLIHPALLVNFILGLYFINHPEILYTYPIEWFYFVLLFACTGPTILYSYSQNALGRPSPKIGDYLLMIALGCGMAYNNSRSILRAILGEPGSFVRTPKQGEINVIRYKCDIDFHFFIEILLGLVGLFFLARVGQIHSIISPFLLLYCLGFLGIGSLSLIEFMKDLSHLLKNCRIGEEHSKPVKTGTSKNAPR